MANGPHRFVTLQDGSKAPFYIIPFDKKGICTGPHMLGNLIEAANTGNFTDIYFFSHGWNNDWGAATALYDDFIEEYQKILETHSLDFGREHRPLMVGVFWPAAALVAWWEKSPKIAAVDDRDEIQIIDDKCVREIAESLPSEKLVDFYQLANEESLGESEALRLAEIIAPLYADSEDDAEQLSGEELLNFWKKVVMPATRLDDGEEDEDFGGDALEEPTVAGPLSFIDPRMVVRALTVWQMKDRAGKVGANGVSKMLSSLIGATPAKVHLVGHSYGCRVLLSALCSPATLPGNRKVSSMLLLQPAINARCFAVNAGDGVPGGYRDAFERVALPILSTFSRDDFPLHNLFHHLVRRKKDLGEVQIAAGNVSKFAALGGYGPQKCGSGECIAVDIKTALDAYNLASPTPAVFAVDSTGTIKGHGDVKNAATAWALFNLVRSSV